MVEIRRMLLNRWMKKRDLEKEVLALRTEVARALEKAETVQSDVTLLKMALTNLLRDRLENTDRTVLRLLDLLASASPLVPGADRKHPPAEAPASSASGAEPER